MCSIVIKYPTMARKCCVTNSYGNYDHDLIEKDFCLPKSKEKKEKCLKIIPRDNTSDSKKTVVCERNWPKDYETGQYYSKLKAKTSSVYIYLCRTSFASNTNFTSKVDSKNFRRNSKSAS